MKKILIPVCLGLAALLSGCAHIKIVSFDNTDRTVVVQGGKWASDDDYEKAAKEWCKSASVSLLNMNQRTVGSYTTATTNVSGSTYGNNFSGTANGTATTVGIHRYDRKYKCD